jgi:hypothetical protein
MAFSWAETITANVTKPKASHISELKTNINTERAARALGGYAWTRTPVIYDRIRQDATADTPDFLDLRKALNQAYDNNYCVGHYTTHQISNLGTHYITHNSSNLAYCPSNYGTNNPGVQTIHCDTNYAGNCPNDYATNNPGVQTSHCDTNYAGNCPNDYATNNPAVMTIHSCPSNYVGHCTTVYGSYQATHYSTHNYANFTTPG